VEGIPEGFEIIHIPEYTWAVFKCVGPTPSAIQAMWERIYKEWLPVSDYELIPDYDIENYLPGDPSSQDYVSEICIPVRKSVISS
jgi:AraC family transcriptional regulator